MIKRTSFVAFGCALLLGAGTAFADRAPNPEERAAIEQVLREAGFISWSKIEFDDGRWEVDNARGPDAKTYDLKLDAASFQIMSREIED